MALINCSECGKEISTNAGHCIHCGNPIEKDVEAIGEDIAQSDEEQFEAKAITFEKPLLNASDQKNLEDRMDLRLITMIIVVIIIVVGGLIVNNSHQRNVMFDKMVKLLQAAKYTEIIQSVDTDSFLYDYAQSRISFKEGDIEMASTYYDDMKTASGIQDIKKYNELTSNQIKKYDNILKTAKIQYGLDLIHQGNYSDASTWFFTLSKDNNGNGQGALYNYASSKESYADGDLDMARYYAEKIKYSGYGEKEINDYRQKISKELTDENIEAAKNKQAVQEKADAKLSGVSIGMNGDQVRNSSWGSPESINTTTTGDTVHEQWCYANNNYLYFEDGVLTTIQN